MNHFAQTSLSLQQALSGALRRITQVAHTGSWSQWASQRLTPTQRKILEILASRRERLMLSAVAQELGVTMATASDSLSALQAKGLVQKQRSENDGRALSILLTAEGQRLFAELAALPDPLQSAFEALSLAEQEVLYRLANKMIRGLQEKESSPVSRMCLRCEYFEPHRDAQSQTPHHCRFFSVSLADRQLRIDCAEMKPGERQAQEAVWERFCAQQGPVKTGEAAT